MKYFIIKRCWKEESHLHLFLFIATKWACGSQEVYTNCPQEPFQYLYLHIPRRSSANESRIDCNKALTAGTLINSSCCSCRTNLSIRVKPPIQKPQDTLLTSSKHWLHKREIKKIKKYHLCKPFFKRPSTCINTHEYLPIRCSEAPDLDHYPIELFSCHNM